MLLGDSSVAPPPAPPPPPPPPQMFQDAEVDTSSEGTTGMAQNQVCKEITSVV